MANEMTSFLTIKNGDENVAKRLQEIFTPREDGEVNAVTILNRVLGTNYSYSNEKEDWNRETDWPDNDIWEKCIGPKWLYVEYDHDDDPESAHIVLRSAWSVPTEFLSFLAEDLASIKEDCYIMGTYEDETYDPMGAFVYAKGFDDIEDYDDEIDFDRMWDDDEYRDELWEEVNQMARDIESYYLEDKAENPENYI